VPKKEFKSSPALAFIGNGNPVHTETKTDTEKSGYYRINLKLKTTHKSYLEQAAWKSHKSITQYINDLIEEDMTRAES